MFFQMLRIVRLTLFALSLTQSYAIAENASLWFDLSSKQELAQFQNVLLKQIESHGLFQIKSADVSLDLLKSRLLSLEQQKQKQMVFIHCTLNDYAKLLKDPDMKTTLSNLQIELLNSRLISLPLYLFGYAENRDSLQLKTSGLKSVQFAFLTLPLEEIYSVQEADLLTMLSQILAKPKNSIRIYREREAYTAAKQLFEGHYNLVGIYEDDPSTRVDEFQINLVEELRAHQAQILPLERSRVSYQLQEASPQRLKYVFFVRPEDPLFPIPAIVQDINYNFPIVLSNLPTRFPESLPGFSKALSDAYFLMLPELSRLNFSDESEKESVQRLYLLNAYLSDPEDRYKSLGFLGYLLLMKDRKWDNVRARDVYDQKCALFLKKLKLNRIQADSLFEWLDLKVPKIERRDLFTGDVSRLYQNALHKIDAGLQSEKEKRKKNFEEARTFLIAALLQGDEPKDVKGGRGLWSVADYNPYYQLARVMLYLQKEK
jgi:hypothetical protein